MTSAFYVGRPRWAPLGIICGILLLACMTCAAPIKYGRKRGTHLACGMLADDAVRPVAIIRGHIARKSLDDAKPS